MGTTIWMAWHEPNILQTFVTLIWFRRNIYHCFSECEPQLMLSIWSLHQQCIFWLASQLGTTVASVHTHAHTHTPTQHTHPTHTTLCTNKPTTILRSEDHILFEITKILWFHRRQARHDTFVTSRVRGRRLELVQAETVYLGNLLFPVRHPCRSWASNTGGQAATIGSCHPHYVRSSSTMHLYGT
jgi:hypothetical protein